MTDFITFPKSFKDEAWVSSIVWSMIFNISSWLRGWGKKDFNISISFCLLLHQIHPSTRFKLLNGLLALSHHPLDDFKDRFIIQLFSLLNLFVF